MVLSIGEYAENEEIRRAVNAFFLIREKALELVYKIPGYKELPRTAKNSIYDAIRDKLMQDGGQIDIDGIINLVGSCRYDYPSVTLTEEDAQRNIDNWLVDGVEIPGGLTAGILAAVWNSLE